MLAPFHLGRRKQIFVKQKGWCLAHQLCTTKKDTENGVLFLCLKRVKRSTGVGKTEKKVNFLEKHIWNY